MSSPNVIVFGPTGSVGSITALTAHTLNATVTLAMRDTTKPIPPNLAQTLNLMPRLQADLSNPASLHAAVTASGAKTRLPLPHLPRARPHARAAPSRALKQAGIEFVVFLSSASVNPHHKEQGLHAITPAVELALADTLGPGGYVAVRPGYFASNLLLFGRVVAEGGVARMVYPEARFDLVAPEDIGRVCGRLLVNKGLSAETAVVSLAGPQVLSQGQAVRVLAGVAGTKVEVENFASDEEAVGFVVQNMGLPEPGARQLVQGFKAAASGGNGLDKSRHEEAVANIKKYGGKEATGIQEWAEMNKVKFT
ncbi:NAD(P)H azoreductase [Chaetomidium leptoderma]|uniref:NAD(P)H azoreductase n=1 Tax=Chaetomidium leptoderma TaxID=669021 RepID=A0AAN7A047_9PEZI|nr:NAD(P)H azoreductase [Chaetomidium leptoderma]